MGRAHCASTLSFGTLRHTLPRGSMRTALALTQITLLSFSTLTGCLSHTRDDVDAGRDTGPVPYDGCSCVDGPRNICASMSAVGVGGCEAELGYVWDGGTCRSISGCSCEGADCARLAPTEAACLEAHRSCSRACGASFGGPLPGCLSGEYCDHPLCGADDGLGTCSEIPDSCAAGASVCGCDGNTYEHLCAAAAAGVAVGRLSACGATSYRSPQMRASCAPTDGPAWTFTLTPSALACEPVPASNMLELEIFTELNTAPSETRYVVGGPGAQGVARLCLGGAPCVDATGSVTVHFFAAGEITRFDYDLTTTEGRRLVETNVEGTNWCRVVGPGCG